METRTTVGAERWGYLLLCSLGLFFVGVIYAWSILKVPFAEDLGWEPHHLALTYTITMVFFCLGSLASGMLGKRVSMRALLLAAAGMILLGYFLSAQLAPEDRTLLYLTYGALIGGGIGLAYNSLLSTGNSWFPDKKGTSSGIQMMCFGFSTMLIGKMVSSFSGPGEWRGTYTLLGGVIAGVLVLCAVALRKPGQGVRFPSPAKRRAFDESFEPRDYSTAEVIRRPAYWLFYVYGTLAASVGSAVISFARELSLSMGATAAFATSLVGVLSICNGLGRILSGYCFDRFGRQATMVAAGGITVLAPLLMLGALQVGSLNLCIVSLCLTGLSFGSCPTISSAFIGTFYGMKDFSLNYSISNTKMLFSSFAATLASSLLVSTGSYTAPFIMLTGFALAALLLTFVIRRP